LDLQIKTRPPGRVCYFNKGIYFLLIIYKSFDFNESMVCLTSVLGGVFFEHVFALLEKLMPESKEKPG
jgi:hypothetical protein